MTQVFVFDLDDTLYKEIDYLKSAYKEIAARLQNMGVADAYLQMLAWHEAKRNVFEMVNEYYHLNIPIAAFLKCYRSHRPSIALSADVAELLERIIASGNKVCLITDGRSMTQRHKIEALGLQRYIAPNDIIISEEFGSEKPAPRNYKYFEKQYPTAKFVYIADNPQKDFVTPNQLGWMTIGLLNNGRNIHLQYLDVEESYLPKLWVKSFTEILHHYNHAQ